MAEICGLLFGTMHSIDAATPCANVAADPEASFEIDPVVLIAAHRAMRQGGPQLIGHYHSHPRGRSEPSMRDADAAMPGDLWLILASDGARLWRARSGGAWLDSFDPVSISIAPSCASAPPSP